MIASLPMYQRPQLVDAHASFWSLIRQRLQIAGQDCPTELSQAADESETWTDPGLVLSQTCGMPYRNSLHGRVTLIGTPDFGLDDCDPGFYRSAVIVRRDDDRQHLTDFASAMFAYNQNHSQSGFSAAYHHVAPLGFWFERRIMSGGHLRSASLVSEGVADIATIDAVTWRLIERYEPFASALKVIDWTVQNPGLPYISRAGVDQSLFFDAVEDAIIGIDQNNRELLGIRGLVSIPAEVYLAVRNPPSEITAAL